jgi:hypothetical protein
MSEVIKRGYDGDWHQGEPQETYASDHADTWSGTRGKSMEYVSDEYPKYLAMQKEWNMKEDIGKLYLQKECIDLLEENEKLRKSNKGLAEAVRMLLAYCGVKEEDVQEQVTLDGRPIETTFSFAIKELKKAFGDNNDEMV